MENQMEEKNEQKSRDPGKGGFGFTFFLSFLAVVISAAGFLFLWAKISYEMRYSTQVIRAGLTFLYILPCLLGGRLLRFSRHSYLPLWGGLLGGSFYGLLLLCSMLVKGESFSYTSLAWTTPLLCVFSGVAGAIPSGGTKKREKNRKSVRNP